MRTSVEADRASGRSHGARRWLAVALAVLVAIAAAVAFVLGTRPRPSRSSSAASGATGAATVERRDLVETDTESGTLSYAGDHTVYDRLGGTISWLPAVGKVIRRGEALFEVDEEPVILLYGRRPAYRELDSSDRRGRDIRELNANLLALGYGSHGIVVDDRWQTATTSAVEALQKSLRQKQTGKILLGRVVFLPGAQLIDATDGSIGSPVAFDGATGGSVRSAAAVDGATRSNAELVDLRQTTIVAASRRPTPRAGTSTTAGMGASSTTTTTSETTTTTTSETTTTTTSDAATQTPNSSAAPAAPAVTETVTVTASSSTASGREAGGGQTRERSSKSGAASAASRGSSPGSDRSGSGGGAALLQTSSTRLVATVELPAGLQSEAVVGSHVSVELPDGSVVRGTVRSVSPVAGSAGGGSGAGSAGGLAAGGEGEGEGSGGSATVPVTITLDKRVAGAGLDRAPVSVGFARASARNVLSVPVTGLVAIAGDAYAVQEAAAPHKLLPVRTGLFAGGYVQVSGRGIHPGLEVTDSQG